MNSQSHIMFFYGASRRVGKRAVSNRAPEPSDKQRVLIPVFRREAYVPMHNGKTGEGRLRLMVSKSNEK